jgi:hypothetical protein
MTVDLGVVWGINSTYPSRAHIVPRGMKAGMCTLPVNDQRGRRPHGHRICPECAIAWVAVIFPASRPEHASSPEWRPH